MTEKELKKLSRLELVEILLKQSTEIEALNKKLKESEEKLNERTLLMDNAGSIAEASLKINDVFAVAQKAADQYVESVQKACDKKQAVIDSEEAIVKQRCEELEAQTNAKCDKMLLEAKTKSKMYYDDARQKLEDFVKQKEEFKAAMDFALN